MLIMAKPLVQVDANIMSAPTPIIAASALMPIVSVECGSAGTSNCAPIWLMRPSGRKSVGSSNIQSGWSRNIDDAWCRKNKHQMNSAASKRGWGALRQGIARLIDSYAEGLIDKDEFEPRIARMRERLKQIEEQAQQIKDEASLERELTLILGRLDEFAARIKTGLHEADWPTRREIIRALVKRVEIDQEQVRVVFRVNPPPRASQLPSEKDAQSLQHCRGRDHTTLWRPSFCR